MSLSLGSDAQAKKDLYDSLTASMTAEELFRNIGLTAQQTSSPSSTGVTGLPALVDGIKTFAMDGRTVFLSRAVELNGSQSFDGVGLTLGDTRSQAAICAFGLNNDSSMFLRNEESFWSDRIDSEDFSNLESTIYRTLEDCHDSQNDTHPLQKDGVVALALTERHPSFARSRVTIHVWATNSAFECMLRIDLMNPRSMDEGVPELIDKVWRLSTCGPSTAFAVHSVNHSKHILMCRSQGDWDTYELVEDGVEWLENVGYVVDGVDTPMSLAADKVLEVAGRK